jgi:hypothetical protein
MFHGMFNLCQKIRFYFLTCKIRFYWKVENWLPGLISLPIWSQALYHQAEAVLIISPSRCRCAAAAASVKKMNQNFVYST